MYGTDRFKVLLIRMEGIERGMGARLIKGEMWIF
jgi:hypothetical protein